MNINDLQNSNNQVVKSEWAIYSLEAETKNLEEIRPRNRKKEKNIYSKSKPCVLVYLFL